MARTDLIAQEAATIPDYRDSRTGGAMVRAACWLASEIREGHVFTKAQLREAIPGFTQIDRRVRELRNYGWVIEEYRSGKNLAPQEQRLIEIGTPVWDPAARKAVAVSAVSDRVREEVFHRDQHSCVRCGIAAGEYFDDFPGRRARLSAAHIYPGSLGGGASADDLVAACQRCNESIQQDTHNYLDGKQMLSRVMRLPKADKQILLERIETNRRRPSELDKRWREYKQLPATERERIAHWLRKHLGD